MSYSWTGPDGFTSTDQSPLITNATTDMEGIYYLTANDRYCDSEPAATDSAGVTDKPTPTAPDPPAPAPWLVNDKPTATASATSPVCVGGHFQLAGGPSGLS